MDGGYNGNINSQTVKALYCTIKGSTPLCITISVLWKCLPFRVLLTAILMGYIFIYCPAITTQYYDILSPGIYNVDLL